jgi:large subunit ribosomal protein L24e
MSACSMAVAREKLRAHRKKTTRAKESTSLVQPLEKTEAAPVREKIKVAVKSRSALIPGEGRSMGMGMDID